MIDRGDIHQGSDCYRQYSASPSPLVMVIEHKADSLIAKFKEAGNVREIDV